MEPFKTSSHPTLYRVRFDLPITRRYRVHTISSPDGGSTWSYKSVNEVFAMLIELGQSRFYMVTEPPYGIEVRIGGSVPPYPEIAPQGSAT